jgi:aldose sugar dehydrogenase
MHSSGGFPARYTGAIVLSTAATTSVVCAGIAIATIPGTPAQPPVPGLTRAAEPANSEKSAVQTVARNLDHPWGLQFLRDGRMLVTERAGRIRIVAKDGALSMPVAGVPKVHAENQGGLFDIALGPHFAETGLVYFSYFEPRQNGDGLTAARARLVQEGNQPRLENLQVIFRAEPVARDPLNIGGRLLFGRDGNLFISVGDRFSQRDQAQNLASDLGKIVRIRLDGSIPQDNPFVGRANARAEIWSLGHRNPEGLAIDPVTGELWEQEHGARGGDEINIIKPGHNYGWPVITYGIDYSGAKIGIGTAKEGMDQPIYYWDPSIAPSGMTFYTGDLFPAWKGSLFNGALKWHRIIRLSLQGDKVSGEEELLSDVGERIRDVRQAPDGALYVLTDETQGRILKLVPSERSVARGQF